MNPSFGRFLRLPPGEQADVFTVAAQRIGTIPSYVEKDFWVCLVLEALYHGLPADDLPDWPFDIAGITTIGP